MNPVTLAIVLTVFMVILFLLRMPIGFAMALVGIIGFSALRGLGPGLSIVTRDLFDVFSSYSYTAITMFILMGTLAFYTGISRRLYDAGYTMFGRLPGGLAISTIAACAMFSAICGSTNATAAAMGRVSLPEMKRYKYDDALATGCVAAAGSLGILIPPSTIFLVYGIMTENSIGKLFISGVIPGIILATLFALTVLIITIRNPKLAPPGGPTTWKEKVQGMTGIIEALVLFLLVILGIFLGWFSPTYAAAAGTAGVIVIGLVRRQLTWQGFLNGVRDAIRINCFIMVIVAGAFVFGHFLTVTNIPTMLVNWVEAMHMNKYMVLIAVIAIYYVISMFMDELALIVLTIPIFYPLILSVGWNPIWFGVIMVVLVEMGVIAPPVGINVFVIYGVAEGVPLTTIYKGIFPFLACMFVLAVLLMVFPALATWLPSFMTY
jgi:tripartite ATP-independent transporter DctM subunit